jgi:hypothetical protein
MQVIDAAPELVTDIVQEMQITGARESSSFTVRVGHHPTLGRVVVISGAKGDAVIVQMT